MNIKGTLIKPILKMDRPVRYGDTFEECALTNPLDNLWWAKVVGTDLEVIVSVEGWPEGVNVEQLTSNLT